MSIRKTYDFSSVGDLKSDLVASRRQNSADRLQIPIGIKVPVELGDNNTGFLKMHTNIEKNLADNFRNMIMTNHGERIGQYDFGANLAELAFELGSEDYDEESIRRIRKTTQKFMPYIQLLTFEPLVDRFDNKEVAKVGVRITYKVNTLSKNEYAIEAIIYTAG